MNSKLTGIKHRYVVDVSRGFGESYEKPFLTKKAALEFAKKSDGYAAEVFEIKMEPVKKRIAKFGNVW